MHGRLHYPTEIRSHLDVHDLRKVRDGSLMLPGSWTSSGDHSIWPGTSTFCGATAPDDDTTSSTLTAIKFPYFRTDVVPIIFATICNFHSEPLYPKKWFSPSQCNPWASVFPMQAVTCGGPSWVRAWALFSCRQDETLSGASAERTSNSHVLSRCWWWQQQIYHRWLRPLCRTLRGPIFGFLSVLYSHPNSWVSVNNVYEVPKDRSNCPRSFLARPEGVNFHFLLLGKSRLWPMALI